MPCCWALGICLLACRYAEQYRILFGRHALSYWRSPAVSLSLLLTAFATAFIMGTWYWSLLDEVAAGTKWVRVRASTVPASTSQLLARHAPAAQPNLDAACKHTQAQAGMQR